MVAAGVALKTGPPVEDLTVAFVCAVELGVDVDTVPVFMALAIID
jgi:hypothetical protein